MNKLYYGDNLEILRNNICDETIDLCYIDPPFNSNRDYNQIYTNTGKLVHAQAQAFVDTWEWSNAAEAGLKEIRENKRQLLNRETARIIEGLFDVMGRNDIMSYLISMTLRICEIYRTLKPTGSFYLHCDATVSHYLKIILDSIFVVRGGEFENEITWKRYAVHSLSKKRFDAIVDTIFFYTKKNGKNTFNMQYQQLPQDELERRFPHIEEKTGRRFQHAALEKSANRSSKTEVRIIQGKETSTKLGWIWSQKTFDERIAKNPYLIYWTENERPRYKIYLDEYDGFPVGSCWYDIKYLSAGDKERLGYPTQKPEALLERIIRTSSNENDVVLDAYCGCGTTVAVAQRLNRQWIGIDITYQSISLIIKRLEDTYGKKISEEFELDGIPKDIESAIALTKKDYVRKEFEKWVILTYSNNKAFINEKKGKDAGIDGVAYMAVSSREQQRVLFSVKSGKVGVDNIRDLRGTIDREKAAIGIFLTIKEPTKDMIKEALAAGKFTNPITNTQLDVIKIVTVQDILNGERLAIPLAADIVKSAKIANQNQQIDLEM